MLSRTRVFAVLMMCTVAAAGCSSTTDSAEPSRGAEPSGGAESTEGTVVEDTTRTVEHARGTTEVPAFPQRVVTLEPVELDTSVALGVIPVGTSVLSDVTGVPAYLGEEAAGIPRVGTVPEPSVESIAALAPDLILGTQSRHADYYDRLSAIAPTVFLEDHAAPWKDNVRSVGTALGLEDRAEALLADYDNRCADIAAEHDTAGRTAQLIRPRNGLLTLYGPSSFAGSTLECVGFTTPPRPDWADEISVDLSPELAAQAAADFIVVTATDPADPAAIPPSVTANASVLRNPHAVDQAYWITGVGPQGGMAVLDDIDRILSQQN